MAPAIRLLYVDDEPTLLEIGKLFLEAGGEYAVDTLTSARVALTRLNRERYDAIISDYQMPEMDGITFLKQLKESGNTTPFIIFTGRGREEIVIEALNEGADFYLQKGGEPRSQFAELSHKIRQAVQQRKALASIHDHERREADIIDFLPDATFAIDTQGFVIAWNRAMEKMTGVSSDQILGKGNFEYSIPFYYERRPILIDLVLADDPVTAGKYPAITRDGTTLFSEITIPHFNNGQGAALWFTASPLYNTRGTIVGAIESIREITERKQAEVALNESEKRFRELSDLLPQVVYETDTRGNLIYANHIAFDLFGYSPEEFRGGLNVMQMLAPGDRERGAAAFRAIFEGKVKTGPAEEYQALRKDGSTFPISIYSSVVFVDGRITGLRGIIVNITEKKQQDHILKTQLNLGLALQTIRGLNETLVTCLDAAIGIADMDSGGIYLVSERDGSVDLIVSRNLGDEFLKSASHYPESSTNAGIVMAGKPIYVQYHKTGTDQHPLWTQEHLRAAAIIPIICNNKVISCLNISSHTVDEFPANARVALETIAIQIGAAIERIRADEALTESEERYRSVINDQTDLIARFCPDGIITFVNEAYRSYFTSLLDLHGIEGKDFREIMQVKDYREVEKFLITLTRQMPIREMERVVNGRDGKKHWQTWSVRALFGREDEPCEYQVVGRDITERRLAEELLRQQTWNLKTINQLAIEFASLSKGDSVTALATKKLMELSGAAVTTFSVYNPTERTLQPTNLENAPGNPDIMIPARGKPPEDIKIPVSTGLFREIVSTIVGTIKIPPGAGNDQIPPFFNPGIRKQMGIDHFMGIAYVIEGELYGTSVLAIKHGQPEPSTDLLESFAHIVAISLRRDRAEATLHESEERLRSFIEQAHEGVSIVDDEGHIIEWNAAQEKITGISRAEALGTCAWDLATRMIPDEHRREEIRSRMKESIELTIKSGKSTHPDPVYYRFLRQDGTIAIANQTVFVVKTSQGHMIGTLNQDVTEQMTANEKIKESESSYRGLFNTVRQAIYILDPEGKFIDVNEGAETMYGYAREEFLGKTPEFLSAPGKNELAEVIAKIHKAFAGEPQEFEFWGLRKNKECFAKDVRLYKGTYFGRDVIIAIGSDITERKRAEEALRQANRKLNLLSGITRHDIKNQLLTLDGFLLMLHKKAGDPALDTYFSRITKASTSISSMIQFTKEYEQIGVNVPVWQNFRTMVDTVAKEALQGEIVMKNDLPGDAEVFADALIGKVCYNLMDNAVRYGGKITTIRFSMQESGNDQIILCEDDGDGIPVDEKEQIFKRGFGKNTGLGLALSREILDITGISIRETGVPGTGARFEITVPKGAYRQSGYQ